MVADLLYDCLGKIGSVTPYFMIFCWYQVINKTFDTVTDEQTVVPKMTSSILMILNSVIFITIVKTPGKFNTTSTADRQQYL